MGVARIRQTRTMFNQNVARPKSGERCKNTINGYIRLLQRQQKEGLTKWLINAQSDCVRRLKAYGIKPKQVQTVVEKKGIQGINVQEYVAPKAVSTKPVKKTQKKEVVKKVAPKKETVAKEVVKKAAPKKETVAKEVVKKEVVKKIAPKKETTKK